MREVFCVVLLLSAISSLKVGHTVYRMIPAVTTRVNRIFRLPWAGARDRSSFVHCQYSISR